MVGGSGVKVVGESALKPSGPLFSPGLSFQGRMGGGQDGSPRPAAPAGSRPGKVGRYRKMDENVFLIYLTLNTNI